MICKPCRNAADDLAEALALPTQYPQLAATCARIGHELCKGPGWCDCQHKVHLQAEGKSVKRDGR